MQAKATLLTEQMHYNPHIKWSKRNELIYKGHTIPKSNMIDLVNAYLRPSTKASPAKGWKEFGSALLDHNIPLTSIVNKALLKRVEKSSSEERNYSDPEEESGD
jgi:hypothetical protein